MCAEDGVRPVLGDSLEHGHEAEVLGDGLEAGLLPPAISHVVQIPQHVLAGEALCELLEHALHDDAEWLGTQVHCVEEHDVDLAIALRVGRLASLDRGLDRFRRHLVPRAHIGEADQDDATSLVFRCLPPQHVARVLGLSHLGLEEGAAPFGYLEGCFEHAEADRDDECDQRRRQTFAQPHGDLATSHTGREALAEAGAGGIVVVDAAHKLTDQEHRHQHPRALLILSSHAPRMHHGGKCGGHHSADKDALELEIRDGILEDFVVKVLQSEDHRHDRHKHENPEEETGMLQYGPHGCLFTRSHSRAGPSGHTFGADLCLKSFIKVKSFQVMQTPHIR